ncbi:AAA domain-containing protein [Mesorhizobium sp.]|uniref:AAA domain-containing protein n=1 Tax=Mesorhizobium sp. TaxID=1871066 RepID=UPI00257F89CA|nr:AAA domain-containing protein [Mesorhizobium sp.]
MQITNCGRGVHKREIKGIDRFKKDLPPQWYGFTNLDVVLGAGKSREVDLIVVADHRIFLVDIKDWHGRIEARDGRWFQNGVDRDSSPVAKINDIVRDVWKLLTDTLKKHPSTKGAPVPNVQGLVVLTGSADRSGIEGSERAKVLTADEFIALVSNPQKQRETFGNVAREIVDRPLTEAFWKERLSRFFGANPTTFRPGSRRFQRYLADDTAKFRHPEDIYREYDAKEEGNQNNLGTLRLWDFTKCSDGRFQTEEGRLEIAGREQQVYHWLRDRDEEIERTLLTPKLDDSERGPQYWEIYDRRRRMQRLSDFAASEGQHLSPSERMELARQMLAAVAGLHRQDAAHLDLGQHSIWLEAPTTVKLSHLLAARYPDVKSLGATRFQFLASVHLPEDVLGEDRGPKRRDVFLLGVAIHTLVFGAPPAGSPPDWDPAADTERKFLELHDWFAEALDSDPGLRFEDATAALEAFNKATVVRPSPDEVIAGLERFRGQIRSQLQLATAFPVVELIHQSDSRDVWRSQIGGEAAIVKLWRQGAWGDLRKEGASILSFLQRAAELKADRPSGLPVIKEILWLGDAIVVAQAWIEGEPLTSLPPERTLELQTFDAASAFVLRLIAIVDGLHQRGIAHGDLQPGNIIVTPDGDPFLIDVLDFSPAADGDRVTGAYAPPSGGRLERDRFALTRIAEEIFAKAELSEQARTRIGAAIIECRERPPLLATLSPLWEAIEQAQIDAKSEQAKAADKPRITISINGSATGPIEQDEGHLFARVRKRPDRDLILLNVRGAREEIEFRIDGTGAIVSAWRRPLDQRFITRIMRYEICKLPFEIVVAPGSFSDLAEAQGLLDIAEIRAEIDALQTPTAPEIRQTAEDETADQVPTDDLADDSLAEEIASHPSVLAPIDVPALWRSLIDVEKELTTEGVAKADSYFDRKTGRHRVAIDLEKGVFDYSRGDSVGVERQDKRGLWRRIGELDLQISRPDFLAIDTSNSATPFHARLVEAGHRLRLLSHFEVESLRRRTSAVDRILAGNGRSQDLLSVFDPRIDTSPAAIDHAIDPDTLGNYGLNQDQVKAFELIAKTRPVGVLQGPPGTGKTRFIAALAHYAITNGLARNVLLASQSHEAVNTAAESVLSLFKRTGGSPSLLRVAMNEELLSQPLRPYYAARVEQSYKDRFRAAFPERIAQVGRAMGVDDKVVGDVVLLETTIRTIVAKLVDLSLMPERDEQRIAGLLETLKRHLEPLGIGEYLSRDDTEDPSTLFDDLAEEFLGVNMRGHGVTPDKFERLRAIASVGRDFVGSISRAQRSFETFLAGTRQIVAGTCVGLGRTSLGLTQTAFDLVIIDEAARCTASELLVPLQSARWAVLVGDQAQLEPHHEPDVVAEVALRTGIAKREIKRSDFERVFSTGYGRKASFSLRTQYRMLPPIGQLVSESFYPTLKLNPGRTTPEVEPSLLPADLDKVLTWVETDGLGSAGHEQRKENSSRINVAEADAIIALIDGWHAHEPFVKWLTTQEKHPAGIGIICMYAEQRNLIEKRLRQSSLGYLLERHVKVGTVDSYQGKENPIIVLSLVRNNDHGILESGVRKIQEGFLSTPNRINVAVSRAMDRLVIVGARRRWRKESPVGLMATGFSKQLELGEAKIVEAGDLLNRFADEGGKAAKRSKTANRIQGGASGAKH